MKSYTDLEQSKKLAEILPLESADMYYMEVSCNNYTIGVLRRLEKDMLLNKAEYYKMFPCWSLASLLERLPYKLCDDDGNSVYLQINKENDVYQLVYEDYFLYKGVESIETDRYEHFVDACYEMVLKLNELKML